LIQNSGRRPNKLFHLTERRNLSNLESLPAVRGNHAPLKDAKKVSITVAKVLIREPRKAVKNVATEIGHPGVRAMIHALIIAPAPTEAKGVNRPPRYG
jgi:hypothetical protein